MIEPSAAVLSDVLTALGCGYWVRDLATGKMYWSPAFRRLHGIAPDEPAKREVFLSHLHPDDREAVLKGFEEAYRKGQGEIRYRCRYADGRIEHLAAKIVVINTPDGRRLGYGINRLDEWHLALRQALAERTRTLCAVIDALPVGLMVFDADLKLRYWNLLAFQILDLPLELAVEGVSFADLIRVPAERGEYGPGDPEQQVAERVALARQFLPHRLERRHLDGRWHLVQGKPFYDAEGRPAGFVSTFTDITSLKTTEAALQVAVDRLQTLIDHLPSAVTLFDADLRLVAWNRKLIELLDFPSEYGGWRWSMNSLAAPTARRCLRSCRAFARRVSGETSIWEFCSSTSTVSSRSMTRRATKQATDCSRRRPPGSAKPCAAAISAPVWEGMSLPSWRPSLT